MLKLKWHLLPAALAAAAVMVAGCAAPPPPAVPKSGSLFVQAFQARGVVTELQPDGRTIVISHEEIPGYMPAMVMPFTARDTNELRGLAAGDRISFQLIVSADRSWIEQVQQLESPRPPAPAPNAPPGLPAPLRVGREVAPLKEGDLLPDYTFTNQLGAPVRLADFRGQALAITFMFTRCPLPEFCPRMAQNFAETQNLLEKSAGGVTNWQLLALSFDPEFDTPAVLREYAERYGCHPAHWSFLTGDRADIAALTEQFGVMFWREKPDEPISHNLRTVVVDPQGRVQKIIPNNDWTSGELVREILKATAVEPGPRVGGSFGQP